MLAIGMNLCVDRQHWYPELSLGAIHRPVRVVVGPGGKAVNVMRAARAHGVAGTLLANLPASGGPLLQELLQTEGHEVVGVATGGEVRAAVMMFEDSGRVTVFNEPGPALTASDFDRILTAAHAQFTRPECGVVVASGSLPPGTPADAYGQMSELAEAAGRRMIVDSAREALDVVLAHHPDIVTPNLSEAESVLGVARAEEVDPTGDDVVERAAAAAKQLVDRGAHAAVVTAGSHGVAGWDGAELFWIDAPVVAVVNPIGAGDSFAAGMAVALERGADLRGAAVEGVATATASVRHPVPGTVDPAHIDEVRRAVTWRAL